MDRVECISERLTSQNRTMHAVLSIAQYATPFALPACSAMAHPCLACMGCLQVRVTPLTTKKVEHQGIKVQLLGQIELASERGQPHEFLSLGKPGGWVVGWWASCRAVEVTPRAVYGCMDSALHKRHSMMRTPAACGDAGHAFFQCPACMHAPQRTVFSSAVKRQLFF